MEQPAVGDWLVFSHPDRRTFCHAVYGDFPNGNLVRAHVAFVDFHRMVRVEEVREHWFETREPRQGGRRRRGRGRVPPQEVLMVGVRFTAVSGTVLWTNFARGDNQWMRIVVPVYV